MSAAVADFMLQRLREIIVTETPAHLERQSDPETGLALIRI